MLPVASVRTPCRHTAESSLQLLTVCLHVCGQHVFEQVEFRQANLANPVSVEKAFQCDGGDTFDIVFNLAAETKYSQSEEVGGAF